LLNYKCLEKEYFWNFAVIKSIYLSTLKAEAYMGQFIKQGGWAGLIQLRIGTIGQYHFNRP